MNEKRVTTIPATRIPFSSTLINETNTKRVAAYARVSTDSEEQLTSYAAQIDYYTKLIDSHESWSFVAVYTDEGITGTSTKKREGFKQMVADALAGNIDLIVTKSVSRFARNTVDSLTTIRELKEAGVEVYFEKENIWTFDGKGELLLTIMSSLAQEESRSISENCTWGQRKRFADGKVTVPFSQFLGYDRGEDGNLVVNPEQAKIVRYIYELFLKGKTYTTIAKILTKEGVPTAAGKNKWHGSSVKSILTNEKYKGDALLQKSFTVDYLTKKKKTNEGEIPQYYVQGNHEAIIDPDLFDMVQVEVKRRFGQTKRTCGKPFSSRIVCADCGGWYGSYVWHADSKTHKKHLWKCINRTLGRTTCETHYVTDAQIKKIFIRRVNKLIGKKEKVIDDIQAVIEKLYDCSALELELKETTEEVAVVAEMIEACIKDNAGKAQDQTEYQTRYDALATRYDKAIEKVKLLNENITERKAKRKEIELFLEEFNNLKNVVNKFSEEMWVSLVDHVTVYSNGKITITFRNGAEL